MRILKKFADINSYNNDIRITNVNKNKIKLLTFISYCKNEKAVYFDKVKELEYLQSTGEQYIDTNIIPDANTGFRLACEYLGNYSTSESLYAFGLRNDANDTRWTIGYNVQNFYYGYGTMGNISSMTQTSTTISSDVCSNAALNYLNDKKFTLSAYCATGGYTTASVNLPTLSFTPQTDIRLFGSSGIVDTYTKWKGRISFAQITQNDEIIRDFIPVKINNIGYMYDQVTGTMYKNNGSSSFICGPDKIPTQYDQQLSYLESTGTQYINLNYYARGTDIVEIRVKSTTNNWNWYAGSGINVTNYLLWNPFFGMQDSGNYKFWGTYVGNKDGSAVTTYFYNQRAGTNSYPGFTPTLTSSVVMNWYTYKFNQKTLYRDCSKMTGTNGGTVDDTILNKHTIYLFAANEPAVQHKGTSKLQIAWFKLRTKTGQLIFDMIPVSKNGIGYMYDRVSGQLFGNAGTGQFVLGPAV